MVARMPRTIVLHKTFPGRRAFIPSNPVREKSVPRYAASERGQKGGLESARHASNSGSGGLGSDRAPGSGAPGTAQAMSAAPASAHLIAPAPAPGTAQAAP